MAVPRSITGSVIPEHHVFPGERVQSGRGGAVGDGVGSSLHPLERAETDRPARHRARIETAAREGR